MGRNWFVGPSLSAAIVRTVSMALCAVGVVVAINVGIVPVQGNNSTHGSGGQAIVNACICAPFLAIAGFLFWRGRRRGRSRHEFAAITDKVRYDKWLVLASARPWAVLVVLANARALLLFYAPRFAPPFEDALYAVGALTVVWLLVFGLTRPLNGLVALGAPGFLEGKAWPGWRPVRTKVVEKLRVTVTEALPGALITGIVGGWYVDRASDAGRRLVRFWLDTADAGYFQFDPDTTCSVGVTARAPDEPSRKRARDGAIEVVPGTPPALLSFVGARVHDVRLLEHGSYGIETGYLIDTDHGGVAVVNVGDDLEVGPWPDQQRWSMVRVAAV